MGKAKLDALPSRGLRIDQKEDLSAAIDAGVAETISLKVLFGFNSDELTEQSEIVLNGLGQALTGSKLSDARVAIAGHTDTKGTDEHNLVLSERRAEAVQNYLAEVFGVPRERMVATGFGEARLKDPNSPESGINRRVEIVRID